MKTNKKVSGQSLIEFALLLPFFFLLVMGLFDLGRAIFYYAILNTSVREGTRYAIVQPYCHYLSNPSACTGSALDSYPLDCDAASSTANINICNEITSKFLQLDELSASTITIVHLVSSSGDPLINIRIDFNFVPITPGIALMGDLPMQVSSQMLMSPIAAP